MNKFSRFNLSNEILKAIEDLGYKEPTEIQNKVIKEVLFNKDIIADSETGSGKTAAFAIPLCEKCIWDEHAPQVLVLSPTRELAIQVNEDFINIGRYKRIKSIAVYGKSPISDQRRMLKQKTHVVVGTPGRILDLIDEKSFDVSNIKYLVIDEADLMLNMGFIRQVEGVIRRLPKKIVKLLFSATIPNEISTLCSKIMHKPVSVKVEKKSIINENVEHYIYYVNKDKKYEALNDVLLYEKPETCVIFCRTKESADELFNYLNNKHYSVIKIHGGLMQRERENAMKSFKKGEYRILAATDIASRGIDVENITHVINFELPVEKEAYVHRIGRSGRAGLKGKALSFVYNENDRYLKAIEEYIHFEIPEKKLPTEDEIKRDLENSIKLLKSSSHKKKDKGSNINSKITKIYLNGGKKKKIRAGDIVGAICSIDGIESTDIGIIDVQDNITYVDILNNKGRTVINGLKNSTIKGKKLKVDKARN